MAWETFMNLIANAMQKSARMWVSRLDVRLPIP